MVIGDYKKYLIYDEPVPYKSIALHPVRMRDWENFYSLAGVLTIDKNSPPIATVETISMSYLEYLFYAHSEELPLLSILLGLLSVVMPNTDEKIEVGYRENNAVHRAFENTEGKVVTGQNEVIKDPLLLIGGVAFDRHDFNKIREVIVEQNLLKVPNDKIDKRIRDAREDAKNLRARISGTKKQASLEDQMVSLFVSTGIPLETIYGLTIRKFIKSLERLDNKIHYEIYLSASMSGFVQFKDKSFIKHWLSDLGGSDLDELISYDSIEAKVSGGNV
jgi:hypothetical protein